MCGRGGTRSLGETAEVSPGDGLCRMAGAAEGACADGMSDGAPVRPHEDDVGGVEGEGGAAFGSEGDGDQLVGAADEGLGFCCLGSCSCQIGRAHV